MAEYEDGKRAGYEEGHGDGKSERDQDWSRRLDEIGGLLNAYDLADGHWMTDEPDDMPAIADKLASDLVRRLGHPVHPEMVPVRFRSVIDSIPYDAWRALYAASAYRYASEATRNRGQVSITTESELAQLATIGAALGVHPDEIGRIAEKAMRQVAA